MDLNSHTMINHKSTFLRTSLAKDPFAFGDFGPQVEDVLRIEKEFPKLFQSNQEIQSQNLEIPNQKLDHVNSRERLSSAAIQQKPIMILKPVTLVQRTHSDRNKSKLVPSNKASIESKLRNIPNTNSKSRTDIPKPKKKENVIPIREVCKPTKKEPSTFKPCSKGYRCIDTAGIYLKQNPPLVDKSIGKSHVSRLCEFFESKLQTNVKKPMQPKPKLKKHDGFLKLTIDQRIIQSVQEKEEHLTSSEPVCSRSKTTAKGFIKPISGKRICRNQELVLEATKPKVMPSKLVVESFPPKSILPITESADVNQIIASNDPVVLSESSPKIESFYDDEIRNSPIIVDTPFPSLWFLKEEMITRLAYIYEEHGQLSRICNEMDQDPLSTIVSVSSKEQTSPCTSSGSGLLNYPNADIELRKEFPEASYGVSPQNLLPKTCNSVIVFPESFESDSEEVEVLHDWTNKIDNDMLLKDIQMEIDIMNSLELEKENGFSTKNKSEETQNTKLVTNFRDWNYVEVPDSRIDENFEYLRQLISSRAKVDEEFRNALLPKPIPTADQHIQTDRNKEMPAVESVSRVVIEHRFSGETFHSRVKAVKDTDSEKSFHTTSHKKYHKQQHSTDYKKSSPFMNKFEDRYTATTPPSPSVAIQEKVKPGSSRTPTNQDLVLDTDFSSLSELTEDIPSKNSHEYYSPMKVDKGTSYSLSQKHAPNTDKSTSCHIEKSKTVKTDGPKTSGFNLYTESISFGEALYEPVLSPGEVPMDFQGSTPISSTLSSLSCMSLSENQIHEVGISFSTHTDL